MDERTHFQLTPTFPLDQQEIGRRKWAHIFKSPKLLVSASCALIVEGISRLRIPFISAACNRLGRALSLRWRTQDAELTAAVIQEMMRLSNNAQDQELQRITRALRSDGYHQYAISVGKFLLLKQRIERELHADGQVSRRNQEVETLVDSLCAAVCEHIQQLTSIDARLAEALTSAEDGLLTSLMSSEQTCHRRIRHAYGTLSETAKRLDLMLSPGSDPVDFHQEQMEQLDKLIEQLQEENEIAVVVDRELRKIDEATRRPH